MNKKSFKYKFNMWVYIVLPIIALLTLPTIFFNLCNIFGWFDRFTTTLFGDIFVIVLGVVVLATFIYTIFFSKYTLNEIELKTTICFFSSKIPLNNIKQIVFYEETNFLVLFFENKEDSVVFTKIMVKDEDKKEFVDYLIKLNPTIHLETELTEIDTKK